MLLLTDRERRFLGSRPVGHLATASKGAVPHVVPICFAISDATLYTTVDEKPKRKPGAMLQRLKNIAENPVASVTVDRYNDDWSRLGFVLVHATARVILPEQAPADSPRIIEALRAKYAQYGEMALERRPLIAATIDSVTTWGRLEP